MSFSGFLGKVVSFFDTMMWCKVNSGAWLGNCDTDRKTEDWNREEVEKRSGINQETTREEPQPGNDEGMEDSIIVLFLMFSAIKNAFLFYLCYTSRLFLSVKSYPYSFTRPAFLVLFMCQIWKRFALFLFENAQLVEIETFGRLYNDGLYFCYGKLRKGKILRLHKFSHVREKVCKNKGKVSDFNFFFFKFIKW